MSDITIQTRISQEQLDTLPMGVIFDLDQAGIAGMKAQATYIAHFMVDEDGNYLDDGEAFARLRQVPRSQYGEIVSAVMEGVRQLAAPKSG